MNYWFVGFNSNPRKPKNRELLQPAVRTALAHATDKARVVSDLCYGRGQPGSTIIQPALGKWKDSSLGPETYDLDLANHMLDTLGYRRGSGGIRMANGHPMSYTIPVSNDIPGYDRLAQIVAEGWASVGVQIKATPLDAAAMFTSISAPNGKYLSSDLHMWYWTGSYDPNTLLNVLTTAQIGGYSDTAFSNAQYDKLYTMQLHEVDVSKRLALVYQMQQLAYQLKPYIVLAYPNAFAAATSGWKGLTMTPVGYFPGNSRRWISSLQGS
jgi:peptide/nickel transport system substrate-binding protein